jgi:hypothetical protein
MNTISVVLGDEFDDMLKDKVFQALTEMGGVRKNFEHLHGGSQDVYIWTYEINKIQVIIEAETYIGLTIKGDEGIVRSVQRILA